jgi:serine/threonine-protein kinase
MGRTTQSVIVVCEVGPANYYYRGLRLSDGASIELANAVRSSGGFDVTNPVDGTRYQVRQTGISITSPNGQVFSEPMIEYAAR